MANFQIDGDDLVLVLTGKEKVWGVRGDARVPLRDVERVDVVDSPWNRTTIKGLRVGTSLPFVVLLGTMLRRGANDVVALYGRSPAVIVNLADGSTYQRLLATVDNPKRTATKIAKAAGLT